MTIKYADGSSRTTANDPDAIKWCLTADLGPGWVQYEGLVWTADAAEEYPDDDGARAAAEILDNDEQRIDLDSL